MTPAAGARPPVVVLSGPTGSGKTALALDLAARLPVEIVSVDSAQVYRGLDIGSAKPDATTRARVPHHLIDIRDPAERYSAGEFVRDARSAIEAIHGRGRLPLLVGGTMLYLRALLRGIARLPEAAPDVRARLEARARHQGWPWLHAELARVDPASAARIGRNDAQRIQRALEVFELAGRPLSELQAATRSEVEGYDWLRLALVPRDRARLRATLVQRFDTMMSSGLAGEVRALHARGDLDAALPAIRSVGYRQLWQWCEGLCSLAAARELAIVATSQLAKRQLTWIRSEKDYEVLDPQAPECSEGLLARVAPLAGRLAC